MASKWYGLGFPRSGNSWMRYICRFLLGMDESYAAGTENEQYRMCHWLPKPLDPSRNLLVIVRNYKEVIIRHWQECDKNNYNFATGFLVPPPPETGNYIDPIIQFDQWRNRKLMVYYEDLITKPHAAIKDIGLALEVDNGRVDALLNNYDHHRERSYKRYPESHTDGKTSLYHSNRLTKEVKRRWDNYIKVNFNELYQKYLIRYEEAM